MKNLKANNGTEKIILDYVLANASEALKEKITAEKKTIQGALKYATHMARTNSTGSAAVYADAVVFGWIMHYFEDEDAAKYETAEAAAKVTTSATVKAAKKAEAAKPKPTKPKDAGNFLFDMEAF